MATLEYIFCCVFIGIFTLALICLAAYGFMWFGRLVITTIRGWRAEDGDNDFCSDGVRRD